jgi:hypothetical protein
VLLRRVGPEGDIKEGQLKARPQACVGQLEIHPLAGLDGPMGRHGNLEAKKLVERS